MTLKRVLPLAFALAVFASVRCSSSPKPGTCVPGQSVACVGANACSGNQVCNAAGTYDPCVCSGGDSGSPTPDSGSSRDGGANPCSTYSTTTVASMRQGSGGCFRLSGVLSIAVTQDTDPRLYVQDPGGSDFSAMVTSCVANSVTHPCPFASQLRNISAGTQLNLTGEYIRVASTGSEQFLLDSYANAGSGSVPAAATVPPSGLQRSGAARNLAFQRVTSTLNMPLAMFDWSPPEFAVAGAVGCPYQLGFGLIPAGGGVSGPPCANATSQPAGMTTVAPAEVLISTELAPGFTVSSDCRCASSVPTVNSSVSGSVSGILGFAVAPGSDAGYFYLAPQSNADLPVGGLAPP